MFHVKHTPARGAQRRKKQYLRLTEIKITSIRNLNEFVDQITGDSIDLEPETLILWIPSDKQVVIFQTVFARRDALDSTNGKLSDLSGVNQICIEDYIVQAQFFHSAYFPSIFPASIKELTEDDQQAIAKGHGVYGKLIFDGDTAEEIGALWTDIDVLFNACQAKPTAACKHKNPEPSIIGGSIEVREKQFVRPGLLGFGIDFVDQDQTGFTFIGQRIQSVKQFLLGLFGKIDLVIDDLVTE